MQYCMVRFRRPMDAAMLSRKASPSVRLKSVWALSLSQSCSNVATPEFARYAATVSQYTGSVTTFPALRYCVSIDSGPVVVPRGAAALGIKPAIQLQGPERDAGAVETGLDRLERLLVGHRVGHVVIVCGAVVGPVADLVQADIGIVGGPSLSAERRQRLSPGVEGAIDSLLDHQQRAVLEAARQCGDVRGNPAG